MRNVLACSCALALAAAVGGCGSDAATGPYPASGAQPNLTSLTQKLFVPVCATGSCHSGTKAKAKLDLSSPDAARMGLLGGDNMGAATCENPSMKNVVPGDPANSLLYLKITAPPQMTPDSACVDAFMNGQPLFDKMPNDGRSLAQSDIDTIKAWIMAGAPLS
jgi:hypothetical protein